jgi:hypothetical protein
MFDPYTLGKSSEPSARVGHDMWRRPCRVAEHLRKPFMGRFL